MRLDDLIDSCERCSYQRNDPLLIVFASSYLYNPVEHGTRVVVVDGDEVGLGLDPALVSVQVVAGDLIVEL